MIILVETMLTTLIGILVGSVVQKESSKWVIISNFWTKKTNHKHSWFANKLLRIKDMFLDL